MKSLFVVISVLCVTYSCSKSEESTTSSSITRELQADTSTWNPKPSSAQKSYELEMNGCHTGKQQFQSDSTEETLKLYCEALQNEETNKGCARDLRQELFEIECDGQFQSFSKNANKEAIKEELGPDFNIRELGLDQYAMEVPIFSPEGYSSVQSSILAVTCLETVQNGLENLNNGLTIFPGTHTAFVKDTNYQFGDGTNSNGAPPYSKISCSSHDSHQLDLEAVNDNPDVAVRKMIAGGAIIDLPITSPEGIIPYTTQFTTFSCVKDLRVGLATGSNGVILMTGSYVLIKRDTNYQFGDGSTSKDSEPFVLIHCSEY